MTLQNTMAAQKGYLASIFQLNKYTYIYNRTNQLNKLILKLKRDCNQDERHNQVQI